MRSWMAFAVSTVALGVAIVGTPITDAATRTVRHALFANNAGTVNGIGASRTPKAGQLLPLTASSRIPLNIVPRANAARIWSDSDQAVPETGAGSNNSETVVHFDRVAFDTAHMFDAARPDRLVIPVTGIYLITASVRWAPSAGASIEGEVIRLVAVNRRGGDIIASDQPADAKHLAQTITSVYEFAAGNAVQVDVGASPQDTNIVTDGQDNPSLSAVWLGPAS